MNEFEKIRKSGGLALREVGDAVGRSYEWVRRVERGKILVSKDTAAQLLKTISELIELRAVEIASRAELFKDRRLPRGRLSKVKGPGKS